MITDKNKIYSYILILMYSLELVICPPLNIDSTLKIEAICPIHKQVLHELNISDVCP